MASGCGSPVRAARYTAPNRIRNLLKEADRHPLKLKRDGTQQPTDLGTTTTQNWPIWMRMPTKVPAVAGREYSALWAFSSAMPIGPATARNTAKALAWHRMISTAKKLDKHRPGSAFKRLLDLPPLRA
jgi:hypothetical protein